LPFFFPYLVPAVRGMTPFVHPLGFPGPSGQVYLVVFLYITVVFSFVSPKPTRLPPSVCCFPFPFLRVMNEGPRSCFGSVRGRLSPSIFHSLSTLVSPLSPRCAPCVYFVWLGETGSGAELFPQFYKHLLHDSFFCLFSTSPVISNFSGGIFELFFFIQTVCP